MVFRLNPSELSLSYCVALNILKGDKQRTSGTKSVLSNIPWLDNLLNVRETLLGSILLKYTTKKYQRLFQMTRFQVSRPVAM